MVDGFEDTSPKDISNCLNNYFCSIGPNLAETNNCHTTEFLQYSYAPVKDSMYCKPVSPEEIIDILSNFKISKSPGRDNIGPRLLKIILNDILDPLQYICNLSFETGVVPSKLKIAKVIPAYINVNKIMLEIIGQYHCLVYLINYLKN